MLKKSIKNINKKASLPNGIVYLTTLLQGLNTIPFLFGTEMNKLKMKVIVKSDTIKNE